MPVLFRSLIAGTVLIAAGQSCGGELPPGIALLPLPPETRVKLVPENVAFEAVAATDLCELKRILEKAGWPRDVIYALVAAEAERRLNPIYVPRDEDLQPFEFWHTGPDALPMANLETPEYMAEMARRDQHCTETIKALFPKTVESSTAMTRWEERARWGTLSEEKKKWVRKIMEETRVAVQEAASLPQGQDWAGMWRIQREARGRIEGMLTPDELLDYDLRNAPTAEVMRNELDNFQPTRDEFLTIFKLRHSLALKFPEQPDEVDPELAAKKKAAQEVVEQQIEAALGRDRYAEYVLSRRPECASLQFYARLTKAADRETVRVLSREVILAQEKLAALATGVDAPAEARKIRTALVKKLEPVFGDKVAERYLVELGFTP